MNWAFFFISCFPELCLPLQGVELIIPHRDRSIEIQHWQHLCVHFGAPFLLYSLLELSIKDFTVLELPVNYICHKHGLLGGFSKATHFFPDFVLTISHSPTGYGPVSPWGMMAFPGTLHLFHHPDREKPLQPNFPTVAVPERLIMEVLRGRDRNIRVPKFWQHSLLPQSFRISTQNTALMCSPTCNALFLLSHTHICLFLFENEMFYISLEKLLGFLKIFAVVLLKHPHHLTKKRNLMQTHISIAFPMLLLPLQKLFYWLGFF